MGRKSIADKPMTGAQRAQRYRDKAGYKYRGVDLKKVIRRCRYLERRIRTLAKVYNASKTFCEYEAMRREVASKRQREVDRMEAWFKASMTQHHNHQGEEGFMIDAPTMKMIRQLCHPDKHNGSQGSTNTTRC